MSTPEPIDYGSQVELARLAQASGAEASRARRAAAPTYLARHGIAFTSHNNGAHLIVGGGAVDYWPGPNHWRVRTTGIRGRGLRELIRWFRQRSRDEGDQEPGSVPWDFNGGCTA